MEIFKSNLQVDTKEQDWYLEIPTIHNRGYENNYFAEAKKLKKGDKIIYYYQGSSREYLVEKNDIIQDTDLSCLEDTEENTMTLITCVENEENYRRCIKAIEKKEKQNEEIIDYTSNSFYEWFRIYEFSMCSILY